MKVLSRLWITQTPSEDADPQQWLTPPSGSLEDALGLIQRVEDEFKGQLDRYKYAERYQDADPLQHRQTAAEFLLELEARLSRGPWLFGCRGCLADAAIAPFVRQFANTDREWFDGQPWPMLLAWLDDFLASPLFRAVMPKLPQWQEDDPVTAFPVSSDTQWCRG